MKSGWRIQQLRDLAILRLTDLFDRPADPECLAVLRQEPAIPGLTEGLVGLSDFKWTLAVKDLERLKLVTLSEPSSPPATSPRLTPIP